MLRQSVLTLALAGTVIAAGCAPAADSEGSSTAEPTAETEHIDWFEGTVEEALAHASENDKPVFLYWGAVWCPPCHYLKDKIFVKPEFVAKSRQFVPVYLDGDTDQAQVWGEKFDARGYPTVIILRPDGTEVLRMSTDVPVDDYAHILDLALAATRPMPEVLEQVLTAGPASANPDDLALLAYHSWGQDRAFDLSSPEMLAKVRRLWAETPEELALPRSRFLSLYVDAINAQEEEAEVAAEERAQLLSAVEQILPDPTLRNSNWYLFAYGLEDVATLLTEEGPERDALVASWLEVAEEAENDESLTTAERLEAFRPRLSASVLERGEDDSIPEDLKSAVRERVDWASERTTDATELQSVMNAMAHLLRDSDQKPLAIELLKSRLDDAVAPYYYMGWIGWLENDAGNPEVAVDWYRRSWETSTGPATRLQRGTTYLDRVMAITPDDLDAVRDGARTLVDEHLVDASAFAGRNASRWSRLEGAMQEWAADNPERLAVLTEVQEMITSTCEVAAPDPESEGGKACRGFLDEAEVM